MSLELHGLSVQEVTNVEVQSGIIYNVLALTQSSRTRLVTNNSSVISVKETKQTKMLKAKVNSKKKSKDEIKNVFIIFVLKLNTLYNSPTISFIVYN